jgi:hypothetical protein
MSSLLVRILTELNPHEESCCCPERDDCACCGAYGMQDATGVVRAILELHKPNPHPSGLGPYCDQCEGGYEGRAMWPCATVLAVAKQLGIEVDSA